MDREERRGGSIFREGGMCRGSGREGVGGEDKGGSMPRRALLCPPT